METLTFRPGTVSAVLLLGAPRGSRLFPDGTKEALEVRLWDGQRWAHETVHCYYTIFAMHTIAAPKDSTRFHYPRSVTQRRVCMDVHWSSRHPNPQALAHDVMRTHHKPWGNGHSLFVFAFPGRRKVQLLEALRGGVDHEQLGPVDH